MKHSHIASIALLAFAFSFSAIANSSFPQGPRTKGDTSKDSSWSGMQQVEVWAVHPGSGYRDGKTYKGANSYCLANNAALATQQQLMAANNAGFSMCAYGWLNQGLVGFVMKGTYSGCGKDGWNSAGYPDKTRKFATYCVGPQAPSNIPSNLKRYISK